MDLLHPGTVWQRNLRSLLIGTFSLIAAVSSASAGPFYIVGGNSETGHPAAGALMYNDEQSCTGTLIAPRVVLTAAHCLADFGSAQGHSFYMGSNANDPSSGTVIEITELIPHAEFNNAGNSYDIGLVRLAEDAPIAPVGFNIQTMDDSFIGQNPLFVGFGVTSGQSEDAGIKRSVNVPITSYEADGFRYELPNQGTCFGDSGGPAFLEIDGTIKVIGVTSWGDQDCSEFGVNTRTDLYADFIQCVVDNGEDCGGRVIDQSGTNETGPGGGGYPDDWCTDGDGYCDEPCETPDSDCDEEGGNNSELGPEDGYCVPGDGFCDDWCDPVDTDCENQEGESSDEEQDASSESSSDELDEESSSESGTDGDDNSNGNASGVNKEGVDAGGCAQASPQGFLWVLLLGLWVALRSRSPIKQM